jgi:hypothetical protein
MAVVISANRSFRLAGKSSRLPCWLIHANAAPIFNPSSSSAAAVGKLDECRRKTLESGATRIFHSSYWALPG